jgi:hypothetical protein
MNNQTLNIIIITIIVLSFIFISYSGGKAFNWLFITKEHKDGNYNGMDSIKEKISSVQNWRMFTGGKIKKNKNKK